MKGLALLVIILALCCRYLTACDPITDMGPASLDCFMTDGGTPANCR